MGEEEAGKKKMKWEYVCDVLERMSASASAPRRRLMLRSLLDAARASGEPYAVLRILLPKRDRIRPQYQLKEASLAACLVHALALAPSSRDGSRLLAWRTSAGSVSGDLSLLAFQVINARQRQQPGQLSIADLHSHLYQLSSSSTREAKVAVLRELIKQTTAQQIKWIIRVILQDMRIGVGEKTVLKEFHPDADALMGFCVDLHHVCEHLASPSARFVHQDLVVGKALKSQHSKRMTSIEAAWDLMKGKSMVAECKFDGDRMQLHKDGDTLYFWSRNGLEHAEYNVALGPLLQRHVTSKRCVLDGELLVWNCAEERFKPRIHNLNRDAARAARKGWDSDELVCYVVFDILYEEDHGSLLHLPLADRHTLLKKFVNPCYPRIVTILPGDGGSKWSIRPKSQEELSQFFTEVVQRGDEGVIVKDLGSQWSPDNRDGRWCKIKPDYLNLGSDLDLLIIGGYYGRGQHGGQIVSYLMAVKDQQKAGVEPSRFLSICRCGIGLSEAEQILLQQKISPHFVKNTKAGTVPPNSGYVVTNNRLERPDVWVSSPKHSMVLQVSAEKRVYSSHTFKAGWTFRFPRAEKVRDDKAWHDCLSVQEFQEMVAAAKAHGNSLVGKYQTLPATNKTIQKKRTRTQSGNMVPAFLQGCDVSHVVQRSSHFQDLIFYICNSGQNEVTQELHAQIKEGGGMTVLNLCHACDFSSTQRAALTSGRDVISMAWLQACLDSTQLLPITPRHYLHLSNATKEKQKDDVDAFGDSYTDAIAPADLCQVFAKMKDQDVHPLRTDVIHRVESKLAGAWQWSMFRSMCLYMLPPVHSTNIDSQAVAQFTLQRLGLEASMRGAEVVPSLSDVVTHVVVFALSTVTLPFTLLLRSIQATEQRQILQWRRVSVVTHSWLLDSLQQQRALPPAAYSLRENTDVKEDHPTADRPNPISSSKSSPEPPSPSRDQEPCPSLGPVQPVRPGVPQETWCAARGLLFSLAMGLDLGHFRTASNPTRLANYSHLYYHVTLPDTPLLYYHHLYYSARFQHRPLLLSYYMVMGQATCPTALDPDSPHMSLKKKTVMYNVH